MPFWVEPNETVMDLVTDRMVANPGFADRYDAIKELRDISQQSLIPSVKEAAEANGFFRVASLQGPLEHLGRVLDPDFLKEKKRFYKWLAKHPQHVTYDRRKERPAVTFQDGKVVL